MHLYFYISFLFLVPFLLNGQDCEQYIVKENNIISSQPSFLVQRANYSYSFEFLSTSQAVFIKVVSVGGEPLLDELDVSFISVYNRRLDLQFTQSPSVKKKDVKIYSNVLILDKSDVEWFTKNELAFIYLKDPSRDYLIKYIAKKDKRYAFKMMSQCFKASLEQVSFANKNVPKNDDEFKGLQLELKDLKSKLRLQIKQEKENAAIEKEAIANDVLNARLRANKKIDSFRGEVIEARRKSLSVIKSKNQWAIDSIGKMNLRFKDKKDDFQEKLAIEEYKSKVKISQVILERDNKLIEIQKEYNDFLMHKEQNKKYLEKEHAKDIKTMSVQKSNALIKVDKDYQVELLKILKDLKSQEEVLNSTLESKILNSKEKLKKIELSALDSLTSVRKKMILSLNKMEREKLSALALHDNQLARLDAENAFTIKRMQEQFATEKEEKKIKHSFELNALDNRLFIEKRNYKSSLNQLEVLNDSLALARDSILDSHAQKIINYNKKASLSLKKIESNTVNKKKQFSVKNELDSLRFKGLLDSFKGDIDKVGNVNDVEAQTALKKGVKDDFLAEILSLHTKYSRQKDELEKQLLQEQNTLAIELLATQEKAYDEFNIIQEQLALAIQEEKEFYAEELQSIKDQNLEDQMNLFQQNNEALKIKSNDFDRQVDIYNTNLTLLDKLIKEAKLKAALEIEKIEIEKQKEINLILKQSQEEILRISTD